MIYVVVDVGCMCCGEHTSVVGVYPTEEIANQKRREHQAAMWDKWEGEHEVLTFSVESEDVKAVVRGEWVLICESPALYQCSVCGDRELYAKNDYPFCPICGSDMGQSMDGMKPCEGCKRCETKHDKDGNLSVVCYTCSRGRAGVKTDKYAKKEKGENE